MSTIDAVITWVDGDDPVLAAKRAQFAGETSPESTRFADTGELYYCLASLLTHAPFLRRIFVITDGQTPQVLKALEQVFIPQKVAAISIVDHKVLYRNHPDRLPVFNSNNLETILYDIPDLSEEFIYLNDDFMVIKPVSESDFFIDGRPVLRGKFRPMWPVRLRKSWRRFCKERFGWKALSRLSFKEFQTNGAAQITDEPRYFWHDHTPHPIRRSAMQAYFDAHPAQRDHNLSHRFRQPTDYGVISMLYALELQRGNTHLADPSLVYCKPADKRDLDAYLARKSRTADERDMMFACLQSMDDIPQAPREAFFEWIAGKIGVPPLHTLRGPK